MLPMAYTVIGESRAHAEERAAVPQRPGRPAGLAGAAVGADELRLLRPGPRRAHHRRAGRVGVGHPGSGAEPAPAHRRHRHAGRPGRPPGHAAAGPPLRGDRPRGGRPDGGVVRGDAATASSSPPPTCPAPTRTWSACCARAAAADCSAPSTRAPRCARTSVSSDRPSAPMAERAARRGARAAGHDAQEAHPLLGAAGRGGRHTGRGPMVGPLGEFGAEVIKVEPPGVGDPMRTWGNRRDGIGLVWKSVSRNKRCVTPATCGSPMARSCSTGCSTSATCWWSATAAERARALGHRLRLGARRSPADRDAAHHRLRAGRPQGRPSRLRHAGRGHERVRPRGGQPDGRPRCRRSCWPTGWPRWPPPTR